MQHKLLRVPVIILLLEVHQGLWLMLTTNALTIILNWLPKKKKTLQKWIKQALSDLITLNKKITLLLNSIYTYQQSPILTYFLNY